jgi:hypothetical protein
MLTLAQLGERYGGKCTRTITRWVRDPKLNFPQPTYIGRTPFFDEERQDAWDRERAMPGRPVTVED